MTDLNLNEDYSVQEAIITLVRNKLNEMKIKLWLSPYTQPGSDLGTYPDDIVNSFHLSLGIPPETVRKAFEQLRRHALHKLAARNPSTATSPTGNITIKLKFVGLKKNNINNEHTIVMDINSKGIDLRKKALEILGSDLNISVIKLIHKGSLITDTDRLSNLQIKIGSSILVLNSTSSLAKDEEQMQLLQKTKEDAELLSSMELEDINSEHYLQLTDQQGRVINIPADERKALTVAMTLHERGRAAMKSRKYNNALPFFLEADKEFSKCSSSQILTSVDNYALLNLDIVWCYLCLGSITDLPDAGRRLEICRDCFDKSYGPNLERLQALKGGHAKESALLARLHLLQAICAYHQNSLPYARNKFHQVGIELESLKVDDAKLAEIISFGYSTAEARLALRSSNGNVENAVYHILKKREERKRIRQMQKLEREQKIKQKRLGKTITGEWVQPALYQQLLSMGYASDKARQALQQADNGISLAVQILQDQQEFLQPVDDEQVAILSSMGFDQNTVEDALRVSNGDVAKAQESLVMDLALDPVTPSTSKDTSLREASQRLQDDIPSEEEDHLDLDMQEETEFLNEYMHLLQK